MKSEALEELTRLSEEAEFYDIQETDFVLHEVANEREAQHEQWGQQDWPTGVHKDRHMFYDTNLPEWSHLAWGWIADRAKQQCQRLAERNELDWVAILFEEVAEFAASTTDAHAREELVQVAAVAVAAIEAIDRRA